MISAASCILKPKLSKVFQSGHVFLPLMNIPLIHVRSQSWDFQGIVLIKFIKHGPGCTFLLPSTIKLAMDSNFLFETLSLAYGKRSGISRQ